VHAADPAALGWQADPFLSAKCDEAIDCLTDVSELVTATMQERDGRRKVAWRQALVAPDGRMTMLLRGLEAVLKQNGASPTPYVAGTSLTVADLAVWRAVGWISSGVLDGIPPTYVPCRPIDGHSILLRIAALPHRSRSRSRPPCSLSQRHKCGGVRVAVARRYIQQAFPSLWALHTAVDREPKVVAWKAAHPHHYRGR
jgi:glutathione S-transferase